MATTTHRRPDGSSCCPPSAARPPARTSARGGRTEAEHVSIPAQDFPVIDSRPVVIVLFDDQAASPDVEVTTERAEVLCHVQIRHATVAVSLPNDAFDGQLVAAVQHERLASADCQQAREALGLSAGAQGPRHPPPGATSHHRRDTRLTQPPTRPSRPAGPFEGRRAAGTAPGPGPGRVGSKPSGSRGRRRSARPPVWSRKNLSPGQVEDAADVTPGGPVRPERSGHGRQEDAAGSEVQAPDASGACRQSWWRCSQRTVPSGSRR
ncbi:DUF6879 family protein [Streptomyces sp. NPDC091368]|uniref:DUF6879 family protein n=1 Tax=Streptomyces sp. NPDC091368 TaxID=3365993 RepID=UPI003822DADB